MSTEERQKKISCLVWELEVGDKGRKTETDLVTLGIALSCSRDQGKALLTRKAAANLKS